MHFISRGITKIMLSAGKKAVHPRWFWNITFLVFVLMFSGFILWLGVSYTEGLNPQIVETVYISCNTRELITQSGSFRMPITQKTNFNLLEKLEPESPINITVSTVTHDVLEVRSGDRIYMQKNFQKSEGFPFWILAYMILGYPPAIFMLVVINTKHPGKRVQQWKRGIGIWN